MAYIGGSEAHAAKPDATDDTDWCGLYLPPPEAMLGLDRETFWVYHRWPGRRERSAGRGGMPVYADEAGGTRR
jgi:hypothetical protein